MCLKLNFHLFHSNNAANGFVSPLGAFCCKKQAKTLIFDEVTEVEILGQN
jgi:hypothetical protein